MSDIVVNSTMLAFIGTLLGIITLIITVITLSIRMERRFTILEQHQFTDADKKCLQELEMKMNFVYKGIENGALSLLKDNTPRLDALLKKAGSVGIPKMELNDLIELRDELTKEMESARQKEDSGRAFALGLLTAVIEYRVEASKRAGVSSCLS